MSRFTEEASEKFIKALVGEAATVEMGTICHLCHAAFLLYDIEYAGPRRQIDNILRWQWPYQQLQEESPFTENDNAWNVLLREAWRKAMLLRLVPTNTTD